MKNFSVITDMPLLVRQCEYIETHVRTYTLKSFKDQLETFADQVFDRILTKYQQKNVFLKLLISPPSLVINFSCLTSSSFFYFDFFHNKMNNQIHQWKNMAKLSSTVIIDVYDGKLLFNTEKYLNQQFQACVEEQFFREHPQLTSYDS